METDDSAWMLPGPDPGSASARGLPRGGDGSSTDGRSFRHSITSPPASGDTVAGRFEIRREIGQGGMGTVYEAFDGLRAELVAVKVLVPGLLDDPEAVRQFISEASIATRLSHPNIVTVYDFRAVEGSYAIIMELLEGRTLRDEIRRRQRASEIFSVEDIDQILGSLCGALAHAHEWTIHRDLKPENVWIESGGEVKLMDFGLAKIVQGKPEPLSFQTLNQLRLGSPYYMAPEQLYDADQATAASDQFGVGVIAYELLTGELPIGLAKPLREMRPDLSYQLTGAVDRALSSDPVNRFSSITAFHQEFARGCRRRPSFRQRIETRPILRQSLKAAGLVAVLATLAGITASVVYRRAAAIETATRHAQDHLLTTRTAGGDLRGLIEGVRRDRADRETALEAVRAAGPVQSQAEEREKWSGEKTPEQFLPRPDLSAILAREVALARSEREFAIADAVWDALSARLGETGLPVAIEKGVAEMEEALRDRDFEAFAHRRQAFAETMIAEKAMTSKIRSLAESRIAVGALSQTRALSPETNQATSRAKLVAVVSPAHGDWDTALEKSTADESALRNPLRAHFDEIAAQHAAAQSAWQARFPKLGPPPIEFLGFPAAKAQAARQWAALDRYDRAAPLLEEASQIVSRWSRELEDLERRCADTWSAAEEAGTAFQNVLGMRFIRIGDSYWSIWETRVMDFARFVALQEGGVARAGEFWKHPGYPQGPTHPVVGIPPDLATAFADWIRHEFQGELTDEVEHSIPGWLIYEKLLASEEEWIASPIKRALCPNIGELSNPKWLSQSSDPAIDGAKFIAPVASGPPATQGLYDLFGNAWEWTHQARVIEGNNLEDDHPLYSLYGGGFFGDTSYHGFSPPDDQTIFVTRHDAVSFRVVMTASNLDARLKAVAR